MKALSVNHLSFAYAEGDPLVISDLSFDVEEGRFCIVLGPSGSGKTTALNLIGGMDKADSGQLLIDGRDLLTFNNKQLCDYRRNDVGFVFQFYNLMPNLTAKENVELSTEMCKDAFSPEEIQRMEAEGMYKQVTLPVEEALTYLRRQLCDQLPQAPILDKAAITEKYGLEPQA